jgi:hypothetical protein
MTIAIDKLFSALAASLFIGANQTMRPVIWPPAHDAQ